MNTLNVEYRKVEALIPYARNPRTHAESQIAKIAASIVEYGWTTPILVDGDNGIIAGHGRFQNFKNVPHMHKPKHFNGLGAA